MTHEQNADAPRPDQRHPHPPGHSVTHQRPLTRMEQKALPIDPETAPDAYITTETGEVFEPAADWGPWKWFGMFMRALCFFRRDAPGHPGHILSSLIAALGRRRRAAATQRAAWVLRVSRVLRPDTHTQ